MPETSPPRAADLPMDEDYVCPQCGPDPRGGNRHAETRHSWPPCTCPDDGRNPNCPFHEDEAFSVPFTAQDVSALSAVVRAAVAEEIAQELERLAENYPPDVFPSSSDSRDAVGGRAMRHAYGVAARTAREHATAPVGGE